MTIEPNILNAIGLICAPGDTHELRILNTRRGTVSGYFNDREAMAKAAAAWSGRADSVYVTLNPCSPDLMARASNRLKEYAKHTTSDADILRRRWLFVDFDPKRPAGISSTHDEHQAALERAKAANEWLAEQGIVWVIEADSGNGGHLLVRIDLPNDDASRLLLERFLKVIAARFGDERITVDTTTINAARICTLYGTMKCKGDETPERPHRPAYIVMGGKIEGVTATEDLEAVAAMLDAPKPVESVHRPVASGQSVQRLADIATYDEGMSDGPFDMAAFIARNGLTTRAAMPHKGGTKWQMDCPFNPDHKAPDAALYVTEGGAAAFKCSHNSCATNGWHELRRKMGDVPQPREPRPAPGPEGSAPPPTEDFFKHTEIGNAERLVARHGKDLRHSPALGQWFVWDGDRWKCGDGVQALVVQRMKETIRSLYGVAASLRKDPEKAQVADALAAWAKKSESNGKIVSCLTLAQSEKGIYLPSEALDADPWLLNCTNGTLDLRTATLRPHRREDLMTKITSVAYVPDAPCPTWEAALEKWQPDPDVRAFLQRAAGYSLTGHTGEETCFFLWGSGRNGKSKFTGAIESVLGDYAARVSIDVLMDARRAGAATPDLIPLIGARFVLASEIPEARRLNEAFIKDITGGDKMTARALYADIVQFKPQFKPWLFGNHKPNVRTTDEGFWARFPLIPFTVFIPAEERDPELAQKLFAEREGILAWAVRGCLEWQEKRLDPPAAVIEASAEYRREQDPFAGFWDACCVLSPGTWARSADIRDAFRAWSGETDEKRLPTPHVFAERLKQMGARPATKRINGQVAKCWLGIGLKASHEEQGALGVEDAPEEDEKCNRVTPVTANSLTTVRARAQAEVMYPAVTGVTELQGVRSTVKELLEFEEGEI